MQKGEYLGGIQDAI